jgi:hypothetical protein
MHVGGVRFWLGSDRASCPYPARTHQMNLQLLCNLKSIFYLDTNVSHCALELAMSKEPLNSAKVLGAPIDQGSFCTTHGVRTAGSNIQTDSCDPRIYDSRVLPSRKLSGHLAMARFSLKHVRARHLFRNAISFSVRDLRHCWRGEPTVHRWLPG